MVSWQLNILVVTNMQVLTLVGSTKENLVPNPLAVLSLKNWLFMNGPQRGNLRMNAMIFQNVVFFVLKLSNLFFVYILFGSFVPFASIDKNISTPNYDIFYRVV